MNIVKIFIWFISMFIISACTNDPSATKTLQVIDIENNINKMEVINLSQFASNIYYMPLETNNDIYLSYIKDCIIFGNYMIVTNLKQCLLYTTEGKFIRQIGKEGRGPGEYQFVNVADFDSDTNIYMQSLRDLLEFKIDGTPTSKMRNQFMLNGSIEEYFTSWILIDDSLFFGHLPNSTGLIKNKALLMNKKAETIKSFKNFILFERDRPVGSGFENFAHVYRFDHLIYYKEFYNDTLFYLDDQFNMIPRYVFNFGKYKEPLSERAKFPGQGFNMSEYLYVYDVFQTNKYILINCQSDNHFTAERLTPRIVNMPDGRAVTVTRNTNRALGIYDKQTENISFCKQTNTDNPLFASGICNDIDAGPRFFPTKQINDSTMLMWIRVDQLLKHVESKDFKDSEPKFPEKKKQLKELVQKLKPEDNGVLMFVTFR
jgi:hypothetical protein